MPKPNAQDMETQTLSEKEPHQDMENNPKETVTVTATPVPKEGLRARTSKTMAAAAFLKFDDTLLPAVAIKTTRRWRSNQDHRAITQLLRLIFMNRPHKRLYRMYGQQLFQI